MKINLREMLKKNPITHNIGKVILKILFNQKWKEKKRCYGLRNPDKTFYIIRPFNSTCGMGSYINYVVINLLYADEKGWIPVVDMKTTKRCIREIIKKMFGNSFMNNLDQCR